MGKSVAFKLGAIGLLVALLLIALSCIGRLVAERQVRRDAVIQDIARSSSAEQQLAGPVVIVPYEKTVRVWREDDHGERHAEEHGVRGQLHLLPETLTIEGDVRTELRARGIYEARLYHAQLRLSAVFDVPLHYGLGSEVAAYRFEQPFIAVGVSDIRGIESPLTAALDGVPVRILPGSGADLLPGGLHVVTTTMSADKPAHLQFTMELPLLGTSELHVIPVGRTSQVQLTSNWPHPSFTGDFLPVRRQLGGKGFSAEWATSFFSTNLEDAVRRCDQHNSCTDFFAHRLGVSFVDPVDQYLKTDRAIKYALLFISLTFAGFFLFDILRKLPVHPVHYGLVGAALALFYLLLLSLSEHVGFGEAYVSSAAACVGLITFYVSHVLRSAARGLGFGSGLALLYGCLYGLLSADDYALLMGALLLFVLLAAFMVLTRNVDWSAIAAEDAT